MISTSKAIQFTLKSASIFKTSSFFSQHSYYSIVKSQKQIGFFDIYIGFFYNFKKSSLYKPNGSSFEVAIPSSVVVITSTILSSVS